MHQTVSTTQPHPAPAPALLRAVGIGKSFGGVRVLDDVPFDLRAGEVHALLGENGAGKSTLLKIMAGVHQPDSGELWLDEQRIHLPSPHAAQKRGIALIHQEPLTFPDLSVTENIFIGRGGRRTRLGTIDWPANHAEAQRLIDELGIDLDPRASVRGLSIADQQMVELAGALAQQARVLLMDEPTAALTPQEVRELFKIVRRLRDQGVAIVFISHRLEEVFDLADRITVLRDGQYVATHPKAELTTQDVIRMMVGRPLSMLFEKKPAAVGEVALSLRSLTRRGKFADISLEVRRGEIVSLAGLVGAGRTDVAQAVFGIAPLDGGEVRVDGSAVRIRSPREAIDRGIVYVPEDRQHHGLLLPFSVAANTSMATLDHVSRLGWLHGAREREIASRWRERLNTRLASVDQPARELSGGNQQKVVLAKWLEADPDILILDEPTRGIDIGAKAEVHRLISELAGQGKAILMISSDLPEVLAMSDRIVVMREGRITGQFERGEATQEKVMAAAVGSATIQSSEQKPPGEAPHSDHASHAREASRPSRLLRIRELGIAVFVGLVVLVTALIEPRFISADNLRQIGLYIPLIVIVAMGQMMVIISRNIDLSVGSTLGLAAIIVGNIFVTHPNFPIPLAGLAAVAIGAGLGLVNGVLIALLRVPAIIATLGTLSVYRGLVFIYSGGRQVDPDKIPPKLIELSQGTVPMIVIIMLVVAAATYLLLRYTRTGREIYAMGSNPQAATLRGIAERRILLLVFTVTGALAGLAGLMYASRYGYVNPVRTGAGFELVVISAAIIGGTNVFGGSGSVAGVILGCLLLAVVEKALPMLGVSAFYQLASYGLAILLAATLDTLIQRRTQRGRGVVA